jgi:hypothetical protein
VQLATPRLTRVIFYKVLRPYSSGMGPNLIAALASVIVIAITVIGQWITRATTGT